MNTTLKGCCLQLNYQSIPSTLLYHLELPVSHDDEGSIIFDEDNVQHEEDNYSENEDQ